MQSLFEFKESNMASLTIRNLDESLKADLRIRAARHGCSMEEEARQILRQTLARGTPDGSLAGRIHGRFATLDAESLPIPPRKPSRPAPELG
jgi:plasmid stability protein